MEMIVLPWSSLPKYWLRPQSVLFHVRISRTWKDRAPGNPGYESALKTYSNRAPFYNALIRTHETG
jgi:hypothetical protein